jgi:hypothetical protein
MFVNFEVTFVPFASKIVYDEIGFAAEPAFVIEPPAAALIVKLLGSPYTRTSPGRVRGVPSYNLLALCATSVISVL